MIEIPHIISHASLANRFQQPSTKTLKFYACHTSQFAQQWHDTFNVHTEGATNKVNFGVINQKSSIANVLKRIEQSPTSEGSPVWTSF